MPQPNLTHLDKIFWPKEKYTKGDVINYYDKISDYILPYLKDRPESLNRHPNGIAGRQLFSKRYGPYGTGLGKNANSLLGIK
jgi:bifunctional non-homologous end joining protein LigD